MYNTAIIRLSLINKEVYQMNIKESLPRAKWWAMNVNVKDTVGGEVLKSLIKYIERKENVTYVLTTFKNTAWGLRSSDNELKYVETKVYKTKKGCENYINTFLNTSTLVHVKASTKCFSYSDRHIDVQQIKTK
tara:strand:- start:395 stop:793 length:399 start_codon:yes stop_codon:yes gene_type:complete